MLWRAISAQAALIPGERHGVVQRIEQSDLLMLASPHREFRRKTLAPVRSIVMFLPAVDE
jgi:hypothetical protein